MSTVVVRGLESDGYLIGNPIIIEISDTSSRELLYAQIILKNMTLSTPTEPLQTAMANAYASTKGLIYVNLQQSIKSIFATQNYFINNKLTTSNKFSIQIRTIYTDGDTDEYTLNRTFIRGWVEDVDMGIIYYNNPNSEHYIKNHFLPKNQWIKISEKEPKWIGFPKPHYYIDNDFNILENPMSFTKPDFDVEIRPKGCNPFYVRFLNSKGAFSYFLFESLIDEYSNESLPDVYNEFNRIDLGSLYNKKYIVKAKVKLDYMPLIRDLLFSSDIHHYKQTGLIGIAQSKMLIRLKMLNNNIQINRNDKSADVSLTFEPRALINPSLL